MIDDLGDKRVVTSSERLDRESFNRGSPVPVFNLCFYDETVFKL